MTCAAVPAYHTCQKKYGDLLIGWIFEPQSTNDLELVRSYFFFKRKENSVHDKSKMASAVGVILKASSSSSVIASISIAT